MGSEAMERAGTSCDGVGDGDESWEMMDLEASMKKLLASSSALDYQQVDRDPRLTSRAQISSIAAGSVLDSGRSEAFPSLVDPDGVDSFLREALQGKDRLTILRLEQEVDKFMRNPKVQQLEFQPMPSSYLRLVAHRVVQHYNLQSSVADSSTPDGARIIARKTSDTCFPRVRLADIPVNTQAEEKQVQTAQQRFELKRRPNKSSKYNRDINGSADPSNRLNPPKTVEERKEEYNRARARIFSNSEFGGKIEEESLVLESSSMLDPYSNGNLRYDKKCEQPAEASARGVLFNGSIRIVNGKPERDAGALCKGNSRVAIFRDREKDRKDPDYDRNYDRYMQRFDPGFGVSQGPPYGVQAVYSPVINYNTEFPQLGGPIRPQICVEGPLHRATPPPLRGPWAGSSSGLSYGHPDSMMGSFNTGHLGSQSGGVFMHPQQFPRGAPTMTYVHSQERFPQSISQPHLQPEGSFSQARRQ